MRWPAVLTDPVSNRGTAFTAEQRRRLGPTGHLPSAVVGITSRSQLHLVLPSSGARAPVAAS